MAHKSSVDVAFFLIGGRSVLSAGFTAITESHEHINERIDGLGDSNDKWGAVGVRRFEMSQEGFFDRGTGSYHEALETADPQVLIYAPVGNVIGDMILALSGVRTEYVILPARHEFHKARALYRANAGPELLGITRLAAPLTARTAQTSNTSGDDWTASSSNGIIAHLAVSELTLGGATDLTVEIEDSPDDGSYANAATFTPVTVAPAAERKIVAGFVDRWTRIKWTFTGAPSGQTALFAVAIARLP